MIQDNLDGVASKELMNPFPGTVDLSLSVMHHNRNDHGSSS